MVLPPKPSQLPYYPINIVILEILTSPPRQSPSLTRAQLGTGEYVPPPVCLFDRHYLTEG